MPDEDSFLAAIAAHPLDDTPRLVYADWLDDRGDPRAEYVRLEVERHRLKPRDKRRAELSVRREALRPLADPHWLSRIDRVGRFNVDCQERYYSNLRREGRVGTVLDQVGPLGPGVSPIPRKVEPGDYLYLTCYRNDTLHLIGRMRIAVVVLIRRDPVPQIVGSEGTETRLYRPVGPEAIARLGWYSRNKERRTKVMPDGPPIFPAAFRGTVRLTLTTAHDFDALLRDG